MAREQSAGSVRKATRMSYEGLVASLDGIVWESDARTFQFTFLSQQAERLLGYPVGDWLAPGFWARHVHPDDREWAVEFCKRATTERRSHDFEYRMVAKDGRTVWLRDIVSVVVEDGEATRLRGVMIDISDAKKAEAALRESEELHRFLTESSNELVALIDADGRFVYASPSFGRLLGEMPAPSSVRRVHPDDLDGVKQAWQATLGGEERTASFRTLSADGRPRWLEAAATLVSFGGAPHVLAIGRDVTERREAEEARRLHLWFFESLDRVNRAIQGTGDLERMLGDVLDVVLSVFECDRAWLVHLRDPAAATWTLAMERSRPEWPGAFPVGIDHVGDQGWAEALRMVGEASGPVRFGPGEADPVPREAAVASSVKSSIAVALRPKVGEPYVFALHRCRHARAWTPDEETLVEQIGQRLADGLTSLLVLRDLRESERRLEAAQRIAHVGHWDLDLDADQVVSSDELRRICGVPADEPPHSRARGRRFVIDEDREAVERAAASAIAGGPRFDMEYRIRRLDGEVRVVHSRGDVVRDPTGRPHHFFGVAQDITERRLAEDGLRASEARFRTFVDHATDAFLLHDGEGVILDANQQACDSLGYTREELIGNTSALFDERQKTREDEAEYARRRARLEAGETVSFETRVRRKDGVDFPVEVRVRPFVEGGRRFAVSLARDISERKRAEEALRASEARFRTFVDHATDAFFLHEAGGTIIDVNRQACESLGYSRAELIGMMPTQIDGDVRPEAIDRIAQRLAAGELVAFDGHHRRKDGSLFPVEVRIRPFWLEERRFAMSLARDVTARKRAEQALVDSHHLLNAVIEGTFDAVFLKDLEGRYKLINSAGARYLGRSVEEVLGKHDRELFTAESAAVLVERDRQVTTSGAPLTFEETVTAAGVTRTFLSAKSVLRDAQGKVTGLIGIAHDVSHQKRLEEQFRQAQKMEAVGRLAGGVAHDFNNLLTVISGNTDLVLERIGASEEVRELLGEIKLAGERATTLTRQLLAFSRKQVLRPEVVDLNALLGELMKLLTRLIGEDIEVTLRAGAGLGLARIDPGQFEQAIVNLAVNARDAMPRGGGIIIETSNVEVDAEHAARHADLKPGSYVRVSVADSGVGMDEETRVRVFEPFFTTKGVNEGTGLGLAMVYGFVVQSGGHVEVHSQPGVGTTFVIHLPRAGGVVAPRATRDPPRVAGGQETILLVEDEDSVRRLVRRMLRRGGYTVLEAGDGEEALAVAERHAGRIDLVVTDLVMPRMSGRELAASLATLRPDARILFMSGYTDEAVIRHGIQEPGTAFVHKPFTATALAERVRELLDAR